MRKSRFGEEQQEYAAGAKATERCRRHGMADIRFTSGKQNTVACRSLTVRRLKDIEDENGKLKKLLAEAMLDNAGLQSLLAKNF